MKLKHSNTLKNDEDINKKVVIYVCNWLNCDKIFNKYGNFNKHYKRHIKPYKCEYCDKKFGDKRNLKVHSRIHDYNKLDKCEYCDAIFTDPSTLRKHILKSHKYIVINNYKCRYCHKKFHRTQNLNRHVEYAHK